MNGNRDNYTKDINQARKTASKEEEWLRNFFSQDRERANQMLEQASGQFGDVYSGYGNMFNSYGLPARTGYAGEYDFARKGYRDLAGGWSPLERQQFQAHATAPAEGAWEAYQMQLDRNRAAQGGYSPGGSALDFKVLRNMKQDLGDLGLGAQVQGRQLETGEKIQGLAGETGIAGNINANKLMGLGGQMGALGGQLSATQGTAGIGSQYANMSNNDLAMMLQARGISQQNINNLMQLRANEPGLFDRIMQIGGLASGGILAFSSLSNRPNTQTGSPVRYSPPPAQTPYNPYTEYGGF